MRGSTAEFMYVKALEIRIQGTGYPKYRHENAIAIYFFEFSTFFQKFYRLVVKFNWNQLADSSIVNSDNHSVMS